MTIPKFPNNYKDQAFESARGSYHPYYPTNAGIIQWNIAGAKHSVYEPLHLILGEGEQGVFGMASHQQPPNLIVIRSLGDAHR